MACVFSFRLFFWWGGVKFEFEFEFEFGRGLFFWWGGVKFEFEFEFEFERGTLWLHPKTVKNH